MHFTNFASSEQVINNWPTAALTSTKEIQRDDVEVSKLKDFKKEDLLFHSHVLKQIRRYSISTPVTWLIVALSVPLLTPAEVG